MAQYFARRTLSMLMVLFIVSVVTFFIMHAIPGGPFDREKALPAQTIAQLNAKYRLDEPVVMQYYYYITDIIVPRITPARLPRNVQEDYLINITLPGGESALRWMNFGPTYRARGRSVNSVIQSTLPISMQVGVAAMLVAMGIGIPAGVLAALRRNSFLD
jgi:ABC-type dipeptide/oligopeptide/nickel transport system permease component